VLHEAAMDLVAGRPVDMGYVRSIREVFALPKVRALLSSSLWRVWMACRPDGNENRPRSAFTLEDVSNCFFPCGAEPSDWDFTDPEGRLDAQRRVIKPHTLVLDRLRAPSTSVRSSGRRTASASLRS
jgi:hypothetical protein